MENKEITTTQKREMETKGELTRTGPVFVPNVDIFEDKNNLVLIADMPGVAKEDISVNLEKNELTIHGKVVPKALGTPLYQEYVTGDYLRTFTISNMIDQSRIEAKMTNGTLRMTLPKLEIAKPKKITVTAG